MPESRKPWQFSLSSIFVFQFLVAACLTPVNCYLERQRAIEREFGPSPGYVEWKTADGRWGFMRVRDIKKDGLKKELAERENENNREFCKQFPGEWHDWHSYKDLKAGDIVITEVKPLRRE